MGACRTLPADVYRATQRLHLVIDLLDRDAGTTAADVAARHGVRRARAYALAAQAREALRDRAPGPAPQDPALVALRARVHALEAERDARPAPPPPDPAAIRFDVRTQRALELLLFEEDCSLRGIQRVVTFLQRRAVAPAFDALPASLGAVHARLDHAGRTACRLAEGVHRSLHATVTCAAADDVFFHRTPVKVLAEPRSSAILQLGRLADHTAAAWDLWLAPWHALRLLVSDEGTDLKAAAAGRGLARQTDVFHERQWWSGHVFHPLARKEAAAAKALDALLERATRPHRPGGRFAPETLAAAEVRRADFERDVYAFVAAEALHLARFDPLAPTGARWTDADLAALDARIAALLATMESDWGEAAAARVRAHLREVGPAATQHRALWALVPVALRPGSTWTPDAVLDAVLRTRACERRVQDGDCPADERRARMREAGALHTRLKAEVANLRDVRREVARLLAYPRRSSSIVEAINSVLRVVQRKHRTVSDAMLWLKAWAWNGTPREEGRRHGRSPYQMLGVAPDAADRPWYELLLDAMAS